MTDAMNAPMTASTQWLERTLDDSANRRISMPEGFLCADAVIRLCQNVTDGLHVNEKIVEKTVREYLPFIATENLMMEAERITKRMMKKLTALQEQYDDPIRHAEAVE